MPVSPVPIFVAPRSHWIQRDRRFWGREMEVFVALQVFFFLCFSTLTFRAPEQIYLLLSFFLDKRKLTNTLIHSLISPCQNIFVFSLYLFRRLFGKPNEFLWKSKQLRAALITNACCFQYPALLKHFWIHPLAVSVFQDELAYFVPACPFCV